MKEPRFDMAAFLFGFLFFGTLVFFASFVLAFRWGFSSETYLRWIVALIPAFVIGVIAGIKMATREIYRDCEGDE